MGSKIELHTQACRCWVTNVSRFRVTFLFPSFCSPLEVADGNFHSLTLIVDMDNNLKWWLSINNGRVVESYKTPLSIPSINIFIFMLSFFFVLFCSHISWLCCQRCQFGCLFFMWLMSDKLFALFKFFPRCPRNKNERRGLKSVQN